MSVHDDFASNLLQESFGCPPDLRTWNGSDPGQRFAVYRNNVRVSLVDALADTFPVVLAMVGDEFFRAMARLYIAEEPPRTALLALYGESFADFIEDFPQAAGLPYLADLARLEMLYMQAYHAADAQPVALADLAGLLGDESALARISFTLHPALHIIRSPYAVVSLWGAHQAVEPAIKLGAIKPEVAESGLLMRQGLAVEVTRIEEAAAAFIENLQQGLVFADAVNTAMPFDLSAALELLIRYGAITCFSIQE